MKKLLILILLFLFYFGTFAQSVTDTVRTNVSDPDGSITSVKVELLSGPTGVTIGAPTLIATSLSVAITFTLIGDYIFQLSATDNEGAVSKIQFNRTVVKNKAPIIDFIQDKTIRLK